MSTKPIEPRPTIAELEGIMVREQEHTIDILPDGTVVATDEKPKPVIKRPTGPDYY